MHPNLITYIKEDALACEWDTAPYLLFSENVEPLVYYSHLFPAAAILILAVFIMLRNYHALSSKIFFTVSLCFVAYAVFDLILWATPDPALIMFFWSFLTYLEPLIYAGILYLFIVLARRRDATLKEKSIVAVMLLPILLLGPTNLNLVDFDYSNCWRLATEGPLATYYVYFIEFVFAIWMAIVGFYTLKKEKESRERRRVVLLLSGSLLFLFAFSFGNLFGTLLQDVWGEEAWVVAQYGFFGLPVFLAVISYLIVEYNIFNIKLLGAQALMLGLIILVGSQLFFVETIVNVYLVSFTLFLSIIGGYLVVRSVKKEIEQRKVLQAVTEQLEKANVRLKELDKQKSEFVSIASHQLRSPITAIRGYASLLLEGSYGKFPKKAVEPLQRIEKSSGLMAVAIEDYLNVSRIESGNMKYNKSDFNLKDEVDNVCDDIRPTAIKKGLVLIFRSKLNSQGVVNADIGKTIQIVQNLITNALKYTEKGTIRVLVRDDIKNKKIYVDVIDTGIGMNDKTKSMIFQKFERADNANNVNRSGTGLGLYVALKMAEGMGGSVSGTSEGDGKGSQFTLELPLAL